MYSSVIYSVDRFSCFLSVEVEIQ